MCSVKTRGNALCGAKAVVEENGVAKCGRHKLTCVQHPSTFLPRVLETIHEDEEEKGPSLDEEKELGMELELAMDALTIEEKEVEPPTVFEGVAAELWRNTEIDPSQLEAFLFSTGQDINEQVVEQFIADVDDCLLHYGVTA
jgi:hypothetical protein